MAQSPDTRTRARLIRDLSKDFNKKNHSVASSTGSNHGSVPDTTLSDFDPENEALMSTRQLDNTTQRLPELRASAKKYGRYNRPEPDFIIDTSAIGRAFPDFTQGGSSSDGSTLSIEIGRGTKKGNKGTPTRFGRSAEFSSNGPAAVGDDTFGTEKAMIGTYEVMYTPPGKPRHVSKKSAGTDHGSLRKDAQLRRASVSQKENEAPPQPLVKTADYGSGSSRQGSGEHRRTLAEMHARVQDEDDASYISEERLPTVNLTAKNTRFGSTKSRQPSAVPNSVPNKFTSTDGFLKELSHGANIGQETNKPPANGTTNSNTMTGNGTQHSFMLPDLPNITELVSGVYQDGTPVFSKHSKSRSRFTSSNQAQASKKLEHLPMDAIPVPEDEKAIFLSLKLLQDKVAELENSRSDAEQKISELGRENSALRAEKKERERFRRSDSAIGMADGGSDDGGDMGKGRGKWIAEKTSKQRRSVLPFQACAYGEIAELESTIKLLQDRVDTSARKVSVAEISTKNLTQERDAAISQLGVAYCTSEELKEENEQLRQENSRLKTEQQLLRDHLQSWSEDREQRNKVWADKEAALREKIERREEAVREIQDMTREVWEMREPSTSQRGKRNDNDGASLTPGVPRKTVRKSSEGVSGRNTQAKVANQVQNEVKRLKGGNQKSSASVPTYRRMVAGFSAALKSQEIAQARSRSKSRQRSTSRVAGNENETSEQKQGKTVVVEEINDTDEPDGTSVGDQMSRGGNMETGKGGHGLEANSAARDNDYSSFLDVSGAFLRLISSPLTLCQQGGEIAKMRAALNEERAARVERLIADAIGGSVNDTMRSAKSTTVVQAVPLPRKSSMKNIASRPQDTEQYVDDDLTGRFNVKAGENTDELPKNNSDDEETSRPGTSAGHYRHHSEPSVRENSKLRRRRPVEEMTSAFILPDITIQGLPTGDGAQPVLSATAQHVLDGIAQHDGRNCTVCSRVIMLEEEKQGRNDTKPRTTIKVPVLVPVSERMPESTSYEEEPTMRPSQPPAEALAIVMKALQDELAHLKMELARHQTAYNKHDPSLSKRKRKSVYNKIEALLKAIDVKADQIYALYDVLEGQKADGHELGDRELELTLNSIGVDLGKLGRDGGHDVLKASRGSEAADSDSVGSDESDEEDLPWEGIENTAETSKSGQPNARRRSLGV
ncbi:MAG: hypothetical protein M1812_005939 [Candelaria pacifica]|nr:MAG: hypothetical protein M1812_005939 [Candelaria pacifica]